MSGARDARRDRAGAALQRGRASPAIPGFYASRSNYDIAARARRARARSRSGVLEQSWRVGGATGAEIAALRGLSQRSRSRNAGARVLLSRSSARAREPPPHATVYFRGIDPAVGRLTKYTVVRARCRPATTRSTSRSTASTSPARWSGPDTMVPGRAAGARLGRQPGPVHRPRARDRQPRLHLPDLRPARPRARTRPARDTSRREDNLRDVLAAYDVLVGHRAVDPGAIAIVGSSYGGYLAAIASALRPVRWLALRVPALYKDADWDMPKGKLNRDELTAYRRSAVPPKDNRALAACAAFRGDVLIVESEHDCDGAAPGDPELHERLRPSPVAHLPDDRGRGPRAVRRALAEDLHLAARQLDERNGAGRARRQDRHRRRADSRRRDF